jgi:Fe-S-cluster containining protein
MLLPESSHARFREAVLSASLRPDARAAVWDVYDRLQQEIDTRRPVCSSSGRCCRFDEFGHRLFVTTLEMGVFLWDVSAMLQRRLGAEKSLEPHTSNRRDFEKAAPLNPGTITESCEIANRAAPISQAPLSPGCPFQVQGLCSVHTIRPFGCRIFFCDASSEQWQHELYAMFHVEHRKLHERLDVPYFYVEWRQALRILGMEALPLAGLRTADSGPETPMLRQAQNKPNQEKGSTQALPRRLSLPQLHF